MENARRWGKTFLLAVYATEECLRRPRTRIVYGAMTLKQLYDFIIPTLEEVCLDAPEDCRGWYDSTRGYWRFPNGSYIHLFGADDKRKADRGRGPAAQGAIFDEAAFTPVLQYVINSVFRPQLLTTGGWMLLASTPAEEAGHDFTRLAEAAEANGTYAKYTIHDNPLLTPERIQAFIEEDAKANGYTVEQYLLTDTFRREHLAERVIDKNLAVLGEDWERYGSMCTGVQPRPEYFDAYTFLDFGGVDPHAALFGYWDFVQSKLVIEREVFLRDNENSQQLADTIWKTERELWGEGARVGTFRGLNDWYLQALSSGRRVADWAQIAARHTEEAPKQPYLRVADNDVQLINDLATLHKVAFVPTEKHELHLQINGLRVMIRRGELLVNPGCTNLLRHLRTTTWQNHRQQTFKRARGEHGDCLAALIYGVRALDRARNPYPPPQWSPGQPVSILAQQRDSELHLARQFGVI